MRQHHQRRLDRYTAERILDRPSGQDQPAGQDRGLDRLADLMSSASSLGLPAELHGEDAIIAAYRRRPLPRATKPRRLLPLLPTGVAILALAGTTAGGMALAGAITRSHGPGDRVSHSHVATRTDPSPTPDHGPATATPTAPGLVGLCQVYLGGGQPSRPVKLAQAAGGKAQIPGFCGRLVAGEQRSHSPRAKPSAKEQRSHPGNPGNGHATPYLNQGN